MPHIRIRSMEDQQVATLSKTLTGPLAAAMQTSEDNFTFEKIATTFFEKGQSSEGTPFIEVLWFPRSQEVQDQAAQIITQQVQKLCTAEYVTVVFQVLAPTAYYENGTHF